MNILSDEIIRKLLDSGALDAEAARRYFREFLPLAWPHCEPAHPFIPNWHIDAIADHLQAVSEGHIKRLLITVPPGHAKSLLVSVNFPAWQWVRNPAWRAICASYSSDLATRDSVRCRALLASDWFRELFRPTWKFASDQNEKDWFANDQKGFRLALGVGGKGTGFRADCLLIDDPINAKKQYSDAALQEAVFWYTQVMSTRLNDPLRGAIVIVMQRLSQRDLAGFVLNSDDFVHLNLPTEHDPRSHCTTVPLRPGCAAWQDPRTEESELLFPQLYTPEVIAQAKKTLGPQGYAAQHQQRPSPAEGGIFKRWWWRFWTPTNSQTEFPAITFQDEDGVHHECGVTPLPLQVDELAQSWDCSFKNLQFSDFVAAVVLGRVGADVFILDQVHKKMDIVATIAAFEALHVKWPEAVAKFVEEKANGVAVIQLLQHRIPGIIPVNPLDGKVARARATAPMVCSGNVYLPHPAYGGQWVLDFIEEHANFPNGYHDDWVDALSQGLARLNYAPLVEAAPDDDEEEPRYFP